MDGADQNGKFSFINCVNRYMVEYEGNWCLRSVFHNNTCDLRLFSDGLGVTSGTDFSH